MQDIHHVVQIPAPRIRAVATTICSKWLLLDEASRKMWIFQVTLKQFVYSKLTVTGHPHGCAQELCSLPVAQLAKTGWKKKPAVKTDVP